MRFLAPLLATLAVGVIAADSQEDITSTVVVTQYTTYCAAASSVLASAVPASSDLPSITVSDGVTYSISRPLVTSTVTRCNECPTSTALIKSPSAKPVVTSRPLISSVAPVASSSASVHASVHTSAPVSVHVPVPVPSGTSPESTESGSKPGSGSGSGSVTTPAGPLFTGAASRVAGAGAGLLGVFALAFLL